MSGAVIATSHREQGATIAIEARGASSWVRWFVPLILASAASRAVILASSAVQLTPDSPGYRDLASNLLHRNLADDPGERTPVYPTLLALCGLHLDAVRLVQMALGLCITAALFSLAWRTTHRAPVATLAAACYGLSISAILHENAILTETLATALIVAVVCLIAAIFDGWRTASGDRRLRADCKTVPSPLVRSHRRRDLMLTLPFGRWRAGALWAVGGEELKPALKPTLPGTTGITLAVSAIAGMIALTRPLYAFLPLVLLLPFLLHARGVRARRAVIARWICCLLLPALLLIGGWSAYNAARFGVFAPTVLTGYNLSNHSGGFIEDAPERDAPLRDVYLRYRDETIRETGSPVTTIWAARPELLARTGLTNAQLSQAFTSLSLRLFLHHPVRYGRSVLVSWARFWNSPGTPRWDGARDATVGRVVGAAWMAQRCVFVALNVAFLLLTLMAASVRRVRRWWSPSPLIVTLCAIVWAASIVQALLERGSNTRFGVPTQPLVAYVVIVSAAPLLGAAWRTRPWRPSCDTDSAVQQSHPREITRNEEPV